MSDHIPELSEEEALGLADIDLEIEEAIRDMDEALDNLDPIDRTLVILYMRWAYLEGYATAKSDLTGLS